MALVHHGINYIEFAVTDMARAKTFYGSAFGWSFTDYGDQYAGIQNPDPNGEGEVGGFLLSEEAAGGGGPLVILFSEDLPKTLAGVKEAGGKILKDPFDFPGGRRFHFQDPDGYELAVWALP